MSAREAEMEAVKAAERSASGGPQARSAHSRPPIGLAWSSEAKEAVTALNTTDSEGNLVVLVSISGHMVPFCPFCLSHSTFSLGHIPGGRYCQRDAGAETR